MKLIKRLGYIDGKYSYGLFWCDFCKQEVIKRLSHGKIQKSCGCDKEFNKGNKYTFKHGEGRGTKLYKVWCSMKERCLNPNNKGFKDYGGRGITICPEWTDKLNGFINFRDWALNNGNADNLVIDRENSYGNYEPSNCRFLSVLESLRNKTTTITMEIANEIRDLYATGKYTQKELAEKYNLHQTTISNIIRNKIWKKEE